MAEDPGAAADLRTIREIVEAARRNLQPEVWDYAVGGAEDEATLRRNRWAIEAITFRPRVLRRVDAVGLATSFLGMPLALPVMLAPVGSIEMFHPDGALAAARAAGRAGTAVWVSTVSAPSMEEVAAGSPAPKVFQIYVRGDRDWLERLVRRAEGAGYDALCLTADSAVYGRRERDRHNRFEPRSVGIRPNVGVAHRRENYQAALTWEDAAWLRSVTRLPLIVKGITCAEDARLAVEHGYEAVCVSNHGGRQLDYLPSTVEVLPEVVDAVGGQAEVVVDGGFLRGTDVAKAVALGARAVLVGKAMVLALGAAGEPGLERLLALIDEELRTATALLGATSMEELRPDCLRVPAFSTLTGPAMRPWLLPS